MPRRRFRRPPNLLGFIRDTIDDVLREWGVDPGEDPEAERIFDELRKRRPRLGPWAERIRKKFEERR